jgi:hypothetical protein
MTYVALDELGQVGVPDLEGDRVGEEVDTALIDLQRSDRISGELSDPDSPHSSL